MNGKLAVGSDMTYIPANSKLPRLPTKKISYLLPLLLLSSQMVLSRGSSHIISTFGWLSLPKLPACRSTAPFSKCGRFSPTRNRIAPIIISKYSSSLHSSSSDGSDVTTTLPVSTRDQEWEQSKTDMKYMRMALDHASIGYGGTYPNPAVGCVLLSHNNEDDDSPVIIGNGFHPRAGMPHAEVFALLEASGHVSSGLLAAKSVTGSQNKNKVETSADDLAMKDTVEELLSRYSSDNNAGSEGLFSNCCEDRQVTAYVTLEPCCHFGKTPPCAMALVHAKVDRVVIGHRDPNPRVDGGGVKLLQEAGITVDFVSNRKVKKECEDMVSCFVKRITADPDAVDYETLIDGKKRRELRKIAGRNKMDGSMKEVVYSKQNNNYNNDDNDGAVPPALLEQVDRMLWQNEIVNLKFTNAVPKKKDAKALGYKIADQLNAHVAQVLGRTVLLYRPADPPVLDLDDLVTGNGEEEDAREESRDAYIPPVESFPLDLNKLTVPVLKEMLSEKGLKVSGNKPDLIERLQAEGPP